MVVVEPQQSNRRRKKESLRSSSSYLGKGTALIGISLFFDTFFIVKAKHGKALSRVRIRSHYSNVHLIGERSVGVDDKDCQVRQTNEIAKDRKGSDKVGSKEDQISNPADQEECKRNRSVHSLGSNGPLVVENASSNGGQVTKEGKEESENKARHALWGKHILISLVHSVPLNGGGGKGNHPPQSHDGLGCVETDDGASHITNFQEEVPPTGVGGRIFVQLLFHVDIHDACLLVDDDRTKSNL